MSKNYVLSLYNKMGKLPFGKKLFSLFASNKAPYFKTVSPLITKVVPSECHCLIKKRRKVENHIGTVHVIAIANGLEMAMGFMAEASIPTHLRWIPKGMDLQYTAKAGSDIRCVALLENNQWQVGDLPVEVTAYDENDVVVVKGIIHLWVSEKPKK
ncbi:hotdog fold domain-containing protein [Psychrosphaera algicola]|uniref:Hotdog fold domain-containing protein n=1 Tax=Psychrosphaera algicola TaxID=3023714 RepID=A0ABT5FH60_9GAMM|nr:hotdog fold domain-containing protein [Psychrosphaera sp. G1-22]MDC2890522.1 hotdog fold domain-containing protein [Psychrosphaera sp. G1-22]